MRTVSFAMLAAFGLAGLSVAKAADLDDDFLRGPDYGTGPAYTAIDWSGAYIGGHGGFSTASLGYTGVFQSLVYQASRNSVAESTFNASTLLGAPSRRVADISYGGYAGYNFQYDDFVFGVEVDYSWFDSKGRSFDSISRFQTLPSGILETVGLTGSSTTELKDFGSLRARVGYAYGSLLPFATAGVALGRARITDRVYFQDYGYNLTAYNANQAQTTGLPAAVTPFGYYPGTFNPRNPSSGIPYAQFLHRSKTKVVGGLSFGGGMEYAVTSNIVLRGEYQYMLFDDFDGHKANVNTIRGGAAVKF